MTQFSHAQIEAMLRQLATPARAHPRLRIVSRPEPQPARTKVATGGLGGQALPTQPYATADP